MKVLVATSHHAPDDDRVYDKEIQSLLEHRHEVILITRNRGTFNPGNANFRHIDTTSASLKAFGETMEDLARSWEPDILIIHEFVLLMAGARLKRRRGIPLVYDVHESHREQWDLQSSKPFPLKQMINWGLDRYERNFLKYVDHVLTVSPVLEARYGQWGLPTTLVPNFPRMRPDPGRVVREPVVVYQGQLSIERGLVPLIQAFAGVPEAIPGARLEIIGPERRQGLIGQLQAILSRMGLEESITISGPRSHYALLDRLTEVQIGVIPFIDHPAFHVALPIKLFEYMLCGCAVIASDLAQIRHYAGDAALLVPPGDGEALRNGLIRLLSDHKTRDELARRSRELVETAYNWQRIEPIFLQILEALA